jgi:mgtE-like transporter
VIVAVADFFITICYTLMVYLFLDLNGPGRFLVLSIASIPAVIVICMLPRNVQNKDFVRAIKSSVPGLAFVAFIANVSGSVLQRINLLTNSRREILAVYPAVTESVGDAGLVVGSTAATKLALGLLRPSLSALKDHSPYLFGAWAASLISFMFYSISSLFLTGGFTTRAFSTLAYTLLAANVIALIMTFVVAYAFSILTFQKGLDPDHFVMPLETSIAGAFATIAILAALLLARSI